MLVLFSVFILLQLELATVHGETGYTALKFGEDAGSYISFSPDMRPFQSAFSVCSWVKRLRSTSYPIWFSYYNYEIFIGDNGYFNRIFGTGNLDSDLTSAFTAPRGQWHHQCNTWSLESRAWRVYYNGLLVGTDTTSSGRTLTLGQVLVIGNRVRSPSSGHAFGGELYQLNVYSKELSSSEVRDMAAGGPCSGGEDLQDDTRQLKWETILQQTRTGNVRETEIDIDTWDCKLAEDLRENKSQLNQTESRLNESLRELTQTRREMEETKQQLNATALQLNSTAHELEETQQQHNSTAHELEETQQQLNSTAHELDEATKRLENMTECSQETAGITQWDLLYSQPFFNSIFTQDLYMKLSSSWDIFEDFVARVKITRGLMDHFNVHHKQETCGPDEGK